MAIDALAAAGATSATTAGRANLVSNFETFLQLLTTQLKNQDPLSPLDSNDFTAQLTQMAGVEQQLLTNDLLQAILSQGSSGLDSAVHYIGKEVVAAGSSVRFENGAASWSYELASNAADVRLEVLNASGQVVWSGAAPASTEGVHDFNWDGSSTTGQATATGGVYTLRVTATDAAGQSIGSQPLIRGVVSAVELYDGVPYVTVGGAILPLSQIISVGAASVPTPEDEESQGLLAMGADVLGALNPMDEIAAAARFLNPMRLF